MTAGITEQEQRLVDAFAGDLEAAAYTAGIDAAVARRMVAKPEVADAIRNRELAAAGKLRPIADVRERQEFWTKTMRGEAQPTDLQIKASELLGRSAGDFIERRILEGPGGGPVLGVQLQVTPVDLADRVKLLAPAQPVSLPTAPIAALPECLR